MASSAVDTGYGASITFDSGFFAQITNVDWSGLSRASIPTTHFGTGTGSVANATFMPSDVIDPGELSIEGHFNPDTSPPMPDAAETCTLTFAEGATWAASAFMTDFEVSVPMEDKMTFSATLKFSGDITITGA